MKISSHFQRLILSRHFVWIASIAFSVYVYAWSTQWTFNPDLPILYGGRFFTEQANSMLGGRLWVPETALPIECFFIDEKCMGYYGIFPSLLRLPFVVVFGSSIPEFNSIFISMAAGLSLWACLDLCSRLLHKTSVLSSATKALAMTMSFIALGPASSLLLIFDPYVYQEAIMWSVAGLLIAANFYWRWVHERRAWLLLGLILASAASAGSRPTTAFVGLIFMFGVAINLYKSRALYKRNLFILVAMSTLPLLMSFGVLTLKMGTPRQDFSKYESKAALQMVSDKNNGSLGYSARYIPTSFFTYFRPDALRVTTEWPWIRFRFGPETEKTLNSETPTGLERITYLPPIEKDSMLLERITSISNIMPLALIATLLSLFSLLRRRQWNDLLVLAAASTSVVVLFVQFSIASRYLADFYPLLALGTVLSVTLMPQFEKLRSRTKRYLGAAMIFSLLFSILAVTMLAVEYAWIYEVDRLTSF